MYALTLRCQRIMEDIVTSARDGQNVVVLVEAKLPHIDFGIFPSLPQPFVSTV